MPYVAHQTPQAMPLSTERNQGGKQHYPLQLLHLRMAKTSLPNHTHKNLNWLPEAVSKKFRKQTHFTSGGWKLDAFEVFHPSLEDKEKKEFNPVW